MKRLLLLSTLALTLSLVTAPVMAAAQTGSAHPQSSKLEPQRGANVTWAMVEYIIQMIIDRIENAQNNG